MIAPNFDVLASFRSFQEVQNKGSLKALLRCAMFRATGLAMALRDKLHENIAQGNIPWNGQNRCETSCTNRCRK